MIGRKKPEIVVGLDIGSTKICVVVGELLGEGDLRIIGVGTQPCHGLKKGVMVDIDSTVESIRRAVDEAQLMTDVEIDSAYVGIAGGHVMGINSYGVVALKDQEITLREIEQVIEVARAVALPVDREVIHVLPQEYTVDDQMGILDPLGMTGKRLEARVHMVTAAVASAHNLVRCVEKAGLEVNDIVLAQLASGEAVLTPAEREGGTVVIDIGGGTTDIALLVGNRVRHTAVLAVGGNHITNDLAFGLNVPVQEAERLKKAHGCASGALVDSWESVQVRGTAEHRNHRFKRRDLCHIIEPRVQEMLQLAWQEVTQSGQVDGMPVEVVLTGGTALLHGITDLAEEIFCVPVRCGRPAGVGGYTELVESPVFATGVGLLQYGVKQYPFGRFTKFGGEHLFARIYHRMREWFTEFMT